MSSLAKRDLREAAAVLGRLLDAIERGEIDAPTSYVARLEGVRTALDALGVPRRAVRQPDPAVRRSDVTLESETRTDVTPEPGAAK